jgi:hypothetical protein
MQLGLWSTGVWSLYHARELMGDILLCVKFLLSTESTNVFQMDMNSQIQHTLEVFQFKCSCYVRPAQTILSHFFSHS